MSIIGMDCYENESPADIHDYVYLINEQRAISIISGMTQQDLLTIWAEEAKVAMDAKRSGIMDLWKVVAERKVIVSSLKGNS